MKTLKLSYTILNAWAQYRYEDAVGMYLGKDIVITPEIELGKAMHDLYELEVNQTKRLPEHFGAALLENPVAEQKLQKIIPVNEDYQILLRGKLDMYDGDTIYEYKVGSTQAINYIEHMQLDYYKLLLPNANLGVYLCYDPYHKRYTKGVKFLHSSNAEAAINHILTHGGEMLEYLLANKLFVDYQIK